MNEKIPFKVSARTARLIGRENVATAKGAVIELVKMVMTRIVHGLLFLLTTITLYIETRYLLKSIITCVGQE